MVHNWDLDGFKDQSVLAFSEKSLRGIIVVVIVARSADNLVFSFTSKFVSPVVSREFILLIALK